jgi:hypothetical protein
VGSSAFAFSSIEAESSGSTSGSVLRRTSGDYIVIEARSRLGIVKAEQSIVDILFTYAALRETSRK